MNTQAEFFNQVCDQWDKTNMPNDQKIAFLLNKADLKTGQSVLDVGTGTGVLLPYITMRTGLSPIDAVDISPGMIRIARQKFDGLPHISLSVLDVENEPIHKKYDRIILYSVFPHLENKIRTIWKLVNLNLRKGGRLIIAHSQSRDFLNHMHKHKDSRISDAALIDVKLQQILFEESGLKVIDADENSEYYYIVIGA